MTKAPLSRLIDKLPIVTRSGSGDPEITAVCYDSRQVVPGAVFVATPGIHVDGHDYIAAAVEAGCVAVVCEELPEHPAEHVVHIQVQKSRLALSTISARFHRHPSRELPVIGVTGTDGKSTTAYLIDQLLGHLDQDSGFISTALIKREFKVERNPFRQSTPEAPELHGFLRDILEIGKQFAVVEATSHGLSERTARLRDLDFHAAVFTNISHEHFDFHGNFEQYRSDKANLFRALDRTAGRRGERDYPIFGVINADDPNAYYFRHATRQPVLSFSMTDPEADLYAGDIRGDMNGTTCVVRWRTESREVRIPLPGPFNVENVLAAVLTVAKLLDHNPLDILELVPRLKSPPGRMEIVSHDFPFVPIVDYAHTPGAYAKVLPLIKGYTPGRLIVLFGSAGERDRDKRGMLGEAAVRHADIIILADEDPRGEDGLALLQEIAAGCSRARPGIRFEEELFIIRDRREAIRFSLQLAGEGDTILYLGKGHEVSIVYDDHVLDWDETKIVAEELSTYRKAGRHR
ncbi:MAG: UDP-N-acetylmuramoyl-L-alanyl-D-glutamate--2,6-diaminopimelate ligase [Spirochaeta sp.]|nr:UDP-N-acetylmuramoyl-L-alanyl-D-glutamate--2,6-diaminopimelate ligase [Spirochaeta sp.]